MYTRIALCVFVNYIMEIFEIMGDYKLNIQNSATFKFAVKRSFRCQKFKK